MLKLQKRVGLKEQEERKKHWEKGAQKNPLRTLENSVLNPIIKQMEKDSDITLLLAYGGARVSHAEDLGF